MESYVINILLRNRCYLKCIAECLIKKGGDDNKPPTCVQTWQAETCDVGHVNIENKAVQLIYSCVTKTVMDKKSMSELM